MSILNERYIIGPAAKLQEEAILNSIKLKSVYPGVYFLTLASNKLEQLEIVTSITYFSDDAKKHMQIVGIAYGKREAMYLVKVIADKVYRDKAAADIRGYFGGET